MLKLTKIGLLSLVSISLMFSLNACTRRLQTNNNSDSTKVINVNKTKDSTDIYGKGYFDYRDTIESYHMGYSIPRDSVYKVENLKAFEMLNLLISKDTLIPGPYLDRGNHLQNIHKYIEAIRDYDRYIELDPYNHSAYQNRGTAHERLKQYDQAIWDYQKVTILKPNDTIANFNKGVVYDVINNPWMAIKEYDTVIYKDPRLAKAYYNRGSSYEKVDKIDEAIKDYEKAIQLNPSYKEELIRKIDYLNYTFK
jgi:tetratricopeptide (TPR) repeat protein